MAIHGKVMWLKKRHAVWNSDTENVVFTKQNGYLVCHLSPENIQNMKCCLTMIVQSFCLLANMQQDYFVDNFYRFFRITEVFWINTQ